VVTILGGGAKRSLGEEATKKNLCRSSAKRLRDTLFRLGLLAKIAAAIATGKKPYTQTRKTGGWLEKKGSGGLRMILRKKKSHFRGGKQGRPGWIRDPKLMSYSSSPTKVG